MDAIIINTSAAVVPHGMKQASPSMILRRIMSVTLLAGHIAFPIVVPRSVANEFDTLHGCLECSTEDEPIPLPTVPPHVLKALIHAVENKTCGGYAISPILKRGEAIVALQMLVSADFLGPPQLVVDIAKAIVTCIKTPGLGDAFVNEDQFASSRIMNIAALYPALATILLALDK